MTEAEMLAEIASLTATNQELTDMITSLKYQLDRHVRIVGVMAEKYPEAVSNAYQVVKAIEAQAS